MQTVLLTGCAGFIGYYTAKKLVEEKYEVIGVDNLNDYYDVRIKEWRLKQLKDYQNFNFFNIDIENREDLNNLFNKYEFSAVLNLAARAGVRASIEDPYIYINTNMVGTLNILELMKVYKINKIVLASTSSLYAGQKLPFVEELAVNQPISPYAASKKAAEMICYTYHHLYKIDVSIVRYFTVFGPAGRPDMSYFRFIKNIIDGKDIEVFGNGSQSRDFTYVADIANGTIKAMKPLGYEIINLGGGKNPVSINTLIEKIEKLIGKKAKINYKNFHAADMMETWADISKADSMLDWKPLISLDEGIEKTIKWHLENEKWLKDIKL